MGFILPDVSQQRWVIGACTRLGKGCLGGEGSVFPRETVLFSTGKGLGVTRGWFLCQKTVLIHAPFLAAGRLEKGTPCCTDGEGSSGLGGGRCRCGARNKQGAPYPVVTCVWLSLCTDPGLRGFSSFPVGNTASVFSLSKDKKHAETGGGVFLFC